MEKIITVKNAEIHTGDDNEWVTLIDHEDKKHNIFAGVKTKAGEWRDLSDSLAMLKDLINQQKLNGQTYKLTKEQNGKFWNVIQIEPVKSVLMKEAVKQVEAQEDDSKLRSVALSYAKDLVVSKAISLTDMFCQANKMFLWLKNKEVQDAVEIHEVIEAETAKATDKSQTRQLPVGGTATTLPRATKEQLDQLSEFKKRGVVIKKWLDKFGWQVKTLNELSKDQATRLIYEINQSLKIE